MAHDSHKYLRIWREHHGYTLDQIVDRLVIHEDKKLPQSKAQLSKIENGKSPYSQRLLEALSDIYGCETWELIGRHPEKEGEVVDLWQTLSDRNRDRALAFIQGLNAKDKAG